MWGLRPRGVFAWMLRTYFEEFAHRVHAAGAQCKRAPGRLLAVLPPRHMEGRGRGAARRRGRPLLLAGGRGAHCVCAHMRMRVRVCGACVCGRGGVRVLGGGIRVFVRVCLSVWVAGCGRGWLGVRAAAKQLTRFVHSPMNSSIMMGVRSVTRRARPSSVIG